jgi:hypothetical protein
LGGVAMLGGGVGGGLRTPSVHVLGLQDPLLPRSRALAQWWASGRAASGDGGGEGDGGERFGQGQWGGGTDLTTTSTRGISDGARSSSSINKNGALPSTSSTSSTPPPRVLQFEHPGGHRFPTGKGAAAQYASIAAAVQAHCSPPSGDERSAQSSL